MQNFASVDDVFCNLSIPEVQSFEVELRAQSSNKRSELRFLVGESYRDLLTTADTIVSMRDKTTQLRQQINIIIKDCDSQRVSKKLNTSQSVPKDLSASKIRVILQFLAELRHLVCHRIRRGEIVVASRLYAMARLLSTPLMKERPEVGQRLRSVRIVLTKALNKCTQISDFACAFAILESASPSTCLKYFLNLQVNKLGACENVREMTKLLLNTIDRTREFGRISELFEDISNRTLLETLRGLPDLNLSLLSRCLDGEVQHYKPYLRSDDLTPTMISGQVTDWLKSSASLLQESATQILINESHISHLISLDKDIRNELNEASQDRIYTIIKPAIQQHVSRLLVNSVFELSKLKESMQKVVDRSGTIQELWTTRLPWSRGSLTNFQASTRKRIRGDSSSFVVFERAYQPSIRVIAQNLEVLNQYRDYQSQRETYIKSIDDCFCDWFAYLHLVADQSSETGTIVAVLRLLLFLCRTNPVLSTATVQTRNIYRKLIPSFELRIHSSSDVRKTFEDGIPVGPSSTVIDCLLVLSSAMTLTGIDIAGTEERAVVRETIASGLQRFTTTFKLETVCMAPAVEKSEVLHELQEDVASTAIQDSSTHHAKFPIARPVQVHSDAPSDSQEEAHDRDATTNGDDKSEDSSSNHDTNPKSAHHTENINFIAENSALRLQMYFDCRFIFDLLKLSPSNQLDHLLSEENLRKRMEQNIQRAVTRNRVLFGAFVD